MSMPFGYLALLQRQQKWTAMAVATRITPKPIDDMRDVKNVALELYVE